MTGGWNLPDATMIGEHSDGCSSLKGTSRYLKDKIICICEAFGLEKGDTLYISADWDGGIGFDYIRDIKFCPVCGKELPDWR